MFITSDQFTLYCCGFVFSFTESTYTVHVQVSWKLSINKLYVQVDVLLSSKSIFIFSLDILKVSICHELVDIHSSFV
ncbi:hypothetical protein GW891_04190 [bacterium]|nr:hypothetical protein [bacterium]